MRGKSYRFNVTWVFQAGEDPELRRMEFDVVGTNVPAVCSKVLGDLNEAGYDRKDIRIIDVANMDIS